MKRLVLVVEGHYDGPAVANLVNRIIEYSCPEAFGAVFVDGDAVRAGNIPKLSGNHNKPNWLKHLRIAGGRRAVGGVLAVIDSDEDTFEGRPFCTAEVARTLAERAKEVGAGGTHSVAVVLLRQEFESLLIAAAEQLPGYRGTPLPRDIEAAPRDAKGWLTENLGTTYKPVSDQLRLVQAVRNWNPVRDRMSCFRRLERAVSELVQAVTTGAHVCTPGPPAGDAPPASPPPADP